MEEPVCQYLKFLSRENYFKFFGLSVVCLETKDSMKVFWVEWGINVAFILGTKEASAAHLMLTLHALKPSLLSCPSTWQIGMAEEFGDQRHSRIGGEETKRQLPKLAIMSFNAQIRVQTAVDRC